MTEQIESTIDRSSLAMILDFNILFHEIINSRLIEVSATGFILAHILIVDGQAGCHV